MTTATAVGGGKHEGRNRGCAPPRLPSDGSYNDGSYGVLLFVFEAVSVFIVS